jgi:S1-C subfamily serine protease
MQSITSICIRIIIAVCVFYSANSRGRALAQGDWVQAVANRSLPSVVTVLSFDGDGKQFGIGSGFIVREDGLVVTCYHVIQKASSVEVRNKEIGSYRVKGVVAVEREMDFAVLKIAAKDLPVVPLGDSSKVQPGEGVVTIGNPKGLTGTISAGLISQILEEDDFTILQTSAPIYPGNSGGPLLNKRGEVIGIVAARVDDGPTLGLAVPINYARRALQNSASVKYTIGEMARIEERISEKEREERLARAIRENFALYKDPDGLFSLAVPKDWHAQRDQYWSDDRSTFCRETVIAPEGATLAQLGGYVSEGLRIQFRLPPRGKVWTRQGIEQWRNSLAQDMVKFNPGFALTDSGTMKFGGTVAQFYTFVGQDRRLPEPEKTVMFVVATSEALVTVEVIAPTSKLNMLDAMQIISAATFEWSSR